MLGINQLKRTKLVVIINGFAIYGGATKPIFNYYKYNHNKGEKVELFDIQSFVGTIKFILAAFFAPRITVNGLGAMSSWLVLLVCYFRSGIIIYCHEAEHAFNDFKKRSPLKFKILKLCFSKSIIACVSQWQCNYVQASFKTKKCIVVYNNIDLDFSHQLDTSKINIVMLGYRMPRKGVELFSRVADLAVASNPDFQFTWIGSGDAGGLYTSQYVNWLGEMLRPEILLQQCDLLFLSSVDDPFPLACLEALAYKKKCVVYKNTGTAEVIRDVSGCAVYDDYTPESAFEAIIKALNNEVDMDKFEKIHQNISSVESFAGRFDAILINLNSKRSGKAN